MTVICCVPFPISFVTPANYYSTALPSQNMRSVYVVPRLVWVFDTREMEDLLRGWGLADVHVSAFKDQAWTLNSLPFITEELVAKIIPQDGPRALFWHHFADFKTSRAGTDIDCDIESDDSVVDVPLAQTRSKRRALNNSQLQLILNAPDINSLHSGLKQSFNGVIVLGHYAAHKSLDNFTRDLLCAHAIHKELEHDFDRRLSREEFSELADKIVDLFPTESKTTWFDIVKKNKCNTVIQGRLRHKYFGLRKVLISSLLIKKTNVLENLEDDEGLNDDLIGDDASDEAFQWLLLNSEPWEEVKLKWVETFLRRKKHLQLSEKVYEYIQKFPCLSVNLGWTLLAADGMKQQPNLEISFKDNWLDYSKFLIALIRREQPQFLKSRRLSTQSSEQQFVSILLELPSLFKVRTLPKSRQAGKKDKCWRPSRAEILDAVCLLVNEIPEIQERIQSRKKILEKYKYPLQPVPVFLGSLAAIRQSFLVIDDHRWELENPFQALEAFFCVTFGLGTEYPVEARHIWLFLQQTFFNIKTSHDFSLDSGLKSFLAGRIKDFELFNSK